MKKGFASCCGFLILAHEEKVVDGKKTLICPKVRKYESDAGSESGKSTSSWGGKSGKKGSGKGWWKTRKAKGPEEAPSDVTPSDSASQVPKPGRRVQQDFAWR